MRRKYSCLLRGRQWAACISHRPANASIRCCLRSCWRNIITHYLPQDLLSSFWGIKNPFFWFILVCDRCSVGEFWRYFYPSLYFHFVSSYLWVFTLMRNYRKLHPLSQRLGGCTEIIRRVLSFVTSVSCGNP